MNVLLSYKDYWPVVGGIENNLRELAVGLRREYGVRTSVLVTSTGRRSWRGLIDGVPVWKIGRLATVARAPIAPGLLAAHRRLRPDVADLHFPYPVGELAYLLAGRGRRLAVTYHSDIVRQQALLTVYRPYLNLLLDRADAIVATSENYARTSEFLAPRREKVRVIPYGIDVEHFAGHDPARVAELHRRYGSPLILFVGQHRYYKGLEYLLAALRDVPPPARLVLAGAGLEAGVGALARDLGVADRVSFIGETANLGLRDWYHAADVFCLPSSHRSEAFGIVQIEALAAGTPVVSTELGTGTSYVNQHGETGLVVPPRDPAALASALNRVLGDPALRARFGRTAAVRARGEFTAATMLARRWELLRELTAQ